MKKLITILAISLISCAIYAGSIEFTYYFSEPSIQSSGNFQSIIFENTLLTGKAGEPALPYHAVKLLLPPGEEAISIEYTFEDETMLSGIFQIYPQQPSRPISSGTDGVFHQRADVYGSSDIYPSIPWGEHSTHFLNGHSFLLSSFTPLRYVPITGEVTYFRRITIHVETRGTVRAGSAIENLNSSAGAAGRIRSLAQNPQMVEEYPAKTNREEDYQILIITPQQFEASFQALKNIYLVRGMKSEIVTTEFINANVLGQDLQQRIRNYIIQQYQGNAIEYVLLGGDVEHVPARGFYCYVQSGLGYESSDIPADLYYSALDGSWNDDGDLYWGEIGEDDLLADVAVARFPVSTLSQLNNMITKTTLYQDQPVLGELRRPLMAGEELWDTQPYITFGEDYLELLIGYREDNGYTTSGIPEDYDFVKLYDHISIWSKNDLIQAINQGTSFIHHSGHATENYVMRLNKNSDINSLTFAPVDGFTHNFALVYTHGCLCGAFDNSDCIAEVMVCIDKFAVAGAFNSRYGWFNEGQTEGPSAHLHREFVDALYNDREQRIGAAHMISKIETAPWVNAPGQWEEGALRWCFYCCNVLGDPVLGVWTDEPISIETTYPEEINPATYEILVGVTSNGMPAGNLDAVVIADGEIAGCARTDISGQATISVPGGFEGVSSAELVISGYNCLPQYYLLSIQVGLDENKPDLSSLTIQPNPFDEFFSLSFQLEQAGRVEIGIYSLSGQLVEIYHYEGKTGKNELNIPASGWPDGILSARILSGNQVKFSRLIHISK